LSLPFIPQMDTAKGNMLLEQLSLIEDRMDEAKSTMERERKSMYQIIENCKNVTLEKSSLECQIKQLYLEKQQMYDNYYKEISNYNICLSELKSDISSIEKEKKKTEKENEVKLAMERDKCVKELREMSEQLKRQQLEKYEAQKKNKSLLQDYSNLQAELNSSKELITEMSSKQQREADEMVGYKKTVEVLQCDKDEAMRGLHKLNQDLQKLKIQNNEMVSMQKINESELTKVKYSVSLLERENQQLLKKDAIAAEEKATLQNQISSLNAENVILANTVEKYEEKNKELAESGTELQKKCEYEVTQMEEKLNKYEMERENMHKECREAIEERKDLNNRLKISEMEYQELKSVVERLADESQTLHVVVENLSLEKENFLCELRHVKAENTKQHRDYKALIEEYEEVLEQLKMYITSDFRHVVKKCE